MNTQEYISSGIVESYVLGLASDQEKAEFERMCAAHPEVKQARDAFEIQLEQQALKAAVKPPADIRSRLFAQIETEKADTIAPGRVIDMPSNGAGGSAPVLKIGAGLRYFAAASVLLLVTSAALNIYFFTQYKSLSSKYDGLVKENAEMAKNNEQIQARYNESLAAMDKLSNPDMAVIHMLGNAVPTSPSPNSLATVYWDTRTKDVYLHVNNMPEASGDKQYQLWAIVDGKPVDAGVFDVVKGVAVITMKNIPKAQVFAITLEKRGGSVSPEGPMYVLGKVS